jgi:Xaa-Pro aminopeptidase
MSTSTKSRITLLRKHISKAGINGLVVPRTDEFQGEYVPLSAERLKWLTGFSGSWGSCIITPKRAALIVDGRYTIQAAHETKGTGIELLSPEPQNFLAFVTTHMPIKGKLGFDPWLTTIAETRRLTAMMAGIGRTVQPTSTNLVDAIWPDRPSAPAKPLQVHPLTYAGASSAEKLAVIRRALTDKKCSATVLTDPQSVAWQFNIRGSDVPHTPLALVRALVPAKGQATLFVDKDRCSKEVIAHLARTATIKPQSDFEKHIKRMGRSKAALLLDPALCPEAIRLLAVKSGWKIVEGQDPCVLPRARKNKIEQQGARKAQLRDGAALSNFLAWLQYEAPQGGLTEISAQDKLLAFRTATGKLVDLSFGTISAAGPNAALPHYHAVGATGRKLKLNEIYLIDSGGQYRDGTTDVTRTVVFGHPTETMRRHNTLVLKGMIAVSMARFPAGTTGVQIDALARAALWQNDLDFDHGTGHGVGSFLSVHEGPARISKAGHVALEPGMILSNEPGFYAKGKYGIRIENLLLVKPATKLKGGERQMLSFETLTFSPIDKALIDTSLMTRTELQWLDGYHQEVFKKLGNLVSKDTKSWLVEACAPLTKNV